MMAGYTRFNSTLVRLRVVAGVFEAGAGVAFQFHSGTIKGYDPTGKNEFSKRFQFHSGTIKGFNGAMYFNQSHTVSIPLWYD